MHIGGGGESIFSGGEGRCVSEIFKFISLVCLLVTNEFYQESDSRGHGVAQGIVVSIDDIVGIRSKQVVG